MISTDSRQSSSVALENFWAAEERRPAERDGVVLHIEQRHVGAVTQQQPGGSRLPELGRDMQRISAAGVRIAARIGQRAIGIEQRFHRRELATLHGSVQLRYFRCCCFRHTAIRSRQGVSTCDTARSARPTNRATAAYHSAGARPAKMRRRTPRLAQMLEAVALVIAVTMG